MRDGNTFRLFYDGSSVASGTNSAAVRANSRAVQIGALNGAFVMAGFIDDLRVTKNVARYASSTYTVPTEAFSNSLPDDSALDAQIQFSAEIVGTHTDISDTFNVGLPFNAWFSSGPFIAGVVDGALNLAADFQPGDAFGGTLAVKLPRFSGELQGAIGRVGEIVGALPFTGAFVGKVGRSATLAATIKFSADFTGVIGRTGVIDAALKFKGAERGRGGCRCG